VGYDYGVQQYVGYIVMASFIGGGNLNEFESRRGEVYLIQHYVIKFV
jgi:hypothetical protein